VHQRVVAIRIVRVHAAFRPARRGRRGQRRGGGAAHLFLGQPAPDVGALRARVVEAAAHDALGVDRAVAHLDLRRARIDGQRPFQLLGAERGDRRVLERGDDHVVGADVDLLLWVGAALAGKPVKGRITLSGYEGSELLVARLLVESGAEVQYVGTACPRTIWSDPDREWLESKGIRVTYRASLEQDLAALRELKPDLAIGTTPVVQAAKEMAIPALYFTNLISARPLMGVAGAGSLATVVNAALANKQRFDDMRAFFDGVGEGHAAGVWEGVPTDNAQFRAEYKRRLDKEAKKRKAEEMI